MTNNIENNIAKNNLKGGEVIASGGFGCVFSPALKCKGAKKRETGKITKLMKNKYALSEYEEISKFKNKLDDIKDYKNYFLIDDITLCEPDKITQSDLLKYSKKCKALKKDKIQKDNINENLDKIMALNIPDGGVPVDDYIYDDGSFEKILRLNIKLKELLKNGIIPMNERNIYHCDLKDSNILVKEFNSESRIEIKTRIIDWGLSTEYIPHKDEPFPKPLRNRPLQFNVPFSVIIFTDAFVHKYTKYIKDGGRLDHDSLKPFVIEYLQYWLQERGPGHYKHFNEIMYILFSEDLSVVSEKDKKTIIEKEYTLPYITNYIIEILIHFTKFRKNGTLNLRVYLDNVFIKILDVWGFISAYWPILELLYFNYDKLSESQMKIFNNLKEMYVKYLYKPRIEPINMNDLYKHLDNLDSLIKDVIDKQNGYKNYSAKGLDKNKHLKSTSKIFKRIPNLKTRKFKKNDLFMLKRKRPNKTNNTKRKKDKKINKNQK